MQILFSGLNEQASRAWVGAPADGASSLEWQPASLFIAEAEMAVGEPGRKWVWFYRAPWVWLAEGASYKVAAALQQWQTQQRAVLQLRRNLREHLLLVNIDRVDARAFAEHVGILCGAPSSPVAAYTSLTSALASLFEQTAPECWTLYEALEAAAWLPEGEPEFRSNRALPTTEGLGELLELIQAGRQMPAVRQQFDKLSEELRQTDEVLKVAQAQADCNQREAGRHLIESEQIAQSLRYDLEQARAAEQNLKNEQGVLLAQLHQVQEELEKQYLANASFKQQHDALTQELASVVTHREHLTEQLEIVQAALTEAQQAQGQLGEADVQMKVASANERADLQSLVEENELLLAQLHSVQEKLENYYLANREMLVAMGQSEHTMHRARNLISQMATHV
ncbi:hypothetical protein G7009_22210 [Pseudomonas capeferrum]|uniref:hypothetical protein n=1 Tax=Pseudomonas capeferrum TaxID=1495066 RepID=UPI0015E326D3|nr:hypothetical protein [Pseudomonas capeferrum]MBA1204433.1 hypothetical protein [Pseudomonas capeferrum]